MTQRLRTQSPSDGARSQSGYSLVEALIVVAIGLILTGFAVVMVQSAVRSYTVSSTANSLSRTIGVARYAGITQGRNSCTLLVAAGNQFGVDQNCNGSFESAETRVQIPPGVTVSNSTSLPLTSLPLTLAPTPPNISCANYAITFNTRGSKTSVCGNPMGGATVHIFFVSGWGNESAVTITGTGRARSWQFINGAWN